MLDEIGTADRAEPWLRDAVERGDRLMGFGHRVYKTDDPRSVMLRDVADQLGGEKMELARHIEATAIKVLDELKPGRRLYTNVEFYAGIVMDSCGVPRELFTPTFAASRVIGWCTHILEQAADNRLIRPSAHVRRTAAAATGARHPRVTGESATTSQNESRGSTSSSARACPACSASSSTRATRDEVVGHIDVSGPLIAGTGFLFAPAVVGLADTLAAAGTGEFLDHDANESFTTIELKCNFLGSAREGERVVGRAVPVHIGRSTQVWDVTVTNETDRPHDRAVPQHPDGPAPALTISRRSDAALDGSVDVPRGGHRARRAGPRSRR